MSCAIPCATDGSQADEITCLKEGKPCHEGGKLLREWFQLMNTEEPNPFVVDEADVNSANPEILTVEEDVDDDDVEIEFNGCILFYVKGELNSIYMYKVQDII